MIDVSYVRVGWPGCQEAVSLANTGIVPQRSEFATNIKVRKFQFPVGFDRNFREIKLYRFGAC